MHRAGLKRIVVDPMVVTTYQQEPKAAIYAKENLWSEVTKINATSWKDVSSAPAIDWSDATWRVNYTQVECCDLAPDRDQVDWSKCRRQDLMAPTGNFTARFAKLCDVPCERRQQLLGALTRRGRPSHRVGQPGAAGGAGGGGGSSGGGGGGGSGLVEQWVKPKGEQEELVALMAYCPTCSV
jgi:uncharacterized membrane protein YgcG